MNARVNKLLLTREKFIQKYISNNVGLHIVLANHSLKIKKE